MTEEQIKARILDLRGRLARVDAERERLRWDRDAIKWDIDRLTAQLRAAREAEATVALARGPAVVVAIEERDE